MSTWYDISTNSLVTVRVGSGGAIETNEDPTAPSNVWVAQTSGVITDLFGIAWNGYVFAAVGASGVILLSLDGVSWTTVTSGVAVSLNAVASAGVVLLAVGDTGTILQSPNGTVWSVVASGTTEHLRGVATGNGEYIIVGDNSTVLTGAITTDTLEIVLVEGIGLSEETSAIGTFGSLVEDSLTQSTGEARQIYLPTFYEKYHNQGVTLGEAVTHEVSGDIESGTDESVTTLDVVVSENVVSSEGLGGALADSGSGLPLFQTVTEAPNFFQLGNLDDAIYNTVVLDETSLLGRWFDSFEELREVINITDATLAQYHKLISDVLGVDDTQVASLLYSMIVNEVPSFDDAAVANGIFIAVSEEQAAFAEAPTASQIFDLLIDEDINALAGFTLREEGSYIGVAMNSKNYAVTEYEDYDFNSLAKIGRNYYGCKSDGIHLLNGTDDAGTAIAAVLRSGQRKIGTKYARVERAYIALRNSGSLVLKTIVRDKDGVKKERWYETANTSDTIRDIRIKLGKGVKAHYWQWELVNEAGADFEIDSLELREIKLTRRV